MIKKLLIIVFLGLFTGQLHAQLFKADTLNYSEYVDLVKEYFIQHKLDSAVILLKYGKDRFPEHRAESSQDLIYAYALAFKNNNVVDEIRWGLDNNYWYGFDASWKIFDSIRDNEAFQKVMERNSLMKEKAQQKSRSLKLVQEPVNFHPDSAYPLFIALHGWGQDMKMFKDIWHADLLKNEFIVVYLQSSQLATMNSFGWQDDKKAYEEIVAAYHEIRSKYNIDTSNVIAGGYSQGGKMSIYASLEDSIPLKGFVAVCPSVPANFEKEKIEKADDDGKKGVIITGANDNLIQHQSSMMNTFRETGFDCRYLVRKDMGHEIPEDLPELLDSRTKYVY